jgi:hypothetical protein
LLGLSTEQDWLYYRDKKITKTVTKKVVLDGEEKTIEIERFQSPIKYKPYYNRKDECWYVFLQTSVIPDLYSGANIQAANNSESVELTIFPNFIVSDYLNFAINSFDANDIEYGDGYNEDNVFEASIIIDIFDQLKNQIQ